MTMPARRHQTRMPSCPRADGGQLSCHVLMLIGARRRPGGPRGASQTEHRQRVAAAPSVVLREGARRPDAGIRPTVEAARVLEKVPRGLPGRPLSPQVRQPETSSDALHEASKQQE